jgi:uncharacterized protein with FMN-binding domain
VLVVGWQAGATAAHNVATISTSGAASPSTDSSPGSTSTPTAAPTPSTSSGASTSVPKTYTGTTVQTQFGPVQVAIVVANRKITDVKSLQLTNQGDRSVHISNYAAPILRREVLAAQSAKVNSVGGATYTSDGYLTSLQSALDQAKL